MIDTKKIWTITRCLISCLVIYLVFRMIDIHGLADIFKSIKLSYCLAAFFISILIRISMAYRWEILIAAQGIKISKIRLLKIIIVSHTIGIIIPSSLGVDYIRAFVLSKQTGNPVESFISIGADRFSGLLALTGIAFGACLLSINSMNNLNYVYISGLLFACCIIIMIFIFLKYNRVNGFLYRYKNNNNKLISKLAGILESIMHYGKNKRILMKVFGFAAFAQFLRILLVYYLSLSLGIKIDFINFAIALPIIMLLLMLPISIGGIGVQEAAYIHFFSPFGMSAEQAIGLSFLCYLDDLLWILIGLIIYLKDGIYMIKEDVKIQKIHKQQIFGK